MLKLSILAVQFFYKSKFFFKKSIKNNKFLNPLKNKTAPNPHQAHIWSPSWQAAWEPYALLVVSDASVIGAEAIWFREPKAKNPARLLKLPFKTSALGPTRGHGWICGLQRKMQHLPLICILNTHQTSIKHYVFCLIAYLQNSREGLKSIEVKAWD